MTDTANLRLPCIEGSQAQKHVTHNEALRILDTLVQLAVKDRDLTAPPEIRYEGDRYIVNAEATGAWAGCEDTIMAWQDGAWQISVPRVGWLAYVSDEGALLAWDGIAWVDAIAALTSLNNMTRLGVCTMADDVNPFSAKLNNALFVAKTVAEGGDGNLRYKLSKESAAKTLSLLFQDNYSGRAEIGLTGDDDFHFKVSADGVAWHEGIVINRATGAVSFPNTTIAGGRETLSANRTYYVRGDGSDANDGLSNSAGGAFATIQKAIDVACGLDLGVHAVTIQVGPGVYTAGVVLKSFVGVGPITVLGDETTPSSVTIGVTSTHCICADAVIGKWVLRGLKLSAATSGNALYVANGSVVDFQNIDFGSVPTPGAHIYVSKGARVSATGPYRISGSAYIHIQAFQASLINTVGITVTITGTPAFNYYAYATNGAGYYAYSMTFSGTATGSRYNATVNAWIDTVGGGANYLPGNAAGLTSSGGQYV